LKNKYTKTNGFVWGDSEPDKAIFLCIGLCVKAQFFHKGTANGTKQKERMCHSPEIIEKQGLLFHY
jgi:hypothetical protein